MKKPSWVLFIALLCVGVRSAQASTENSILSTFTGLNPSYLLPIPQTPDTSTANFVHYNPLYNNPQWSAELQARGLNPADQAVGVAVNPAISNTLVPEFAFRSSRQNTKLYQPACVNCQFSKA